MTHELRRSAEGSTLVLAIGELTLEHVGIALTGNPRLVPELYPHMAGPVWNAAAHQPTATTSATNSGSSPPDPQAPTRQDAAPMHDPCA